MAVQTFVQPRKVLPDPYPQSSTWRYTAVLEDETGAPLPIGMILSVRLTLWAALFEHPVVNGVSDVDGIGSGRVSIDASGNVRIVLTPSDMAILSAPPNDEDHVLLIKVVYAGGTKQVLHEVQFRVHAMPYAVPTV